MTSQELIALIRDIGFPAAVALYVLMRLDTRLREMQNAITNLILTLQHCQFDHRYPPQNNAP